MNILETILAKKRTEVARQKEDQPVRELEKKPFFRRETLSFRDFLLRGDKSGIIAEFKRKSPSRGVINDRVSVASVTTDYAKYGASAISVLTDAHFFGGSMDDLTEATVNEVPLLRKDFIIDEYQLIESKAFGAAVILLIAACLSPAEVKVLAAVAKNLGLNVLLEIHNEQELAHICKDVDVVGVNNRDLKTFRVDLERSAELGKLIPEGIVKVSESGLDTIGAIKFLRSHGFDGFLIGEKFMKDPNPGLAFKKFSDELKM